MAECENMVGAFRERRRQVLHREYADLKGLSETSSPGDSEDEYSTPPLLKENPTAEFRSPGSASRTTEPRWTPPCSPSTSSPCSQDEKDFDNEAHMMRLILLCDS